MKRAIILTSVLAMLPLCGCTTIAEKGFYEVMGARGEMIVIKTPKLADLRTYKSIRLGEVNNDIKTICPPELEKSLNTYMPAAFSAAKDVWPGGEPTLTVHIDIDYAQTKGSVISSSKLLIARVSLVGKDDAPVGTLTMLAKSEAMRTSAEDLGKAGSEAFVKYFRKTLGLEESGKTKEKEDDD